MTENTDEQLSAFMDDELSASEQERLAGRLVSDESMRSTASRYGLIGEALRQQQSVSVERLDIADKVRAAVADEPTVLAPRKKVNRPQFTQSFWGGAVAASVALISLFFVLPGLDKPDNAVANFESSTVAQTDFAPQQHAQTVSATWRTNNPQLNEKLNRYLMEHNEMSAQTGLNGPAAQANFVSYSGRY